MRSRASWKKLDCIFALSKWILLLACLLSLTPRGIIAQKENETFESAFGLNLSESIENQSTEENFDSPLQTKEETKEAPLELEDLAVEKEDLTPIEKTDDVESPVQVLSEVENAFAAKGKSGTDSLTVQKASGRMANEKNGKYVRYGK